MTPIRQFFHRVGALFRKNNLESEMAEEMQHHLNQRAAENAEDGMEPGEARLDAARRFGGMAQIQEAAREEWSWVRLEQLAQDLRYAGRQLRKAPGFTTVAVLSLALGIGANTAVFSLVHEVLLKTLPVSRPEELVLLRWQAVPIPPADQRDVGFTNALLGDWTDPATNLETSYAFPMLAFDRFRERSQTLAEVFGFFAVSDLNVMVDGQADISRTGQYVTGNYYSALGVNAALGRTLLPEDERANAPAVAVISHGFWQRRFGGAASAVGTEILVNKVPVTIVGVTPASFPGTLDVGDVPDLSLPLSQIPQHRRLDRVRNDWWLRIMGRLQPGATREQAQAELAGLFRESVQEGIANTRSWRKGLLEERYLPKLQVEAGGRGLNETRPQYARSLLTLMGLVGLVLLLACANVTNLLLARGAARRREIAMRLALGAGRARLVRQLLAESVLLALLGGAGGVALAWWGKEVLLAMHPLGWGGPATLELRLDLRVLGFTSALTAFTCVAAGLLPALRATRLDLTQEFKGGRSTASPATLRLRRGLMIVQVALSAVVLIAAGLFGRSLRELQRVDVGFSGERLLLFRVDATPAGYTQAQFPQLHRRLTEAISALPEVRSAAVAAYRLFEQSNRRVLWLPGQPLPPAEDWARINAVGADFFTTMGIPLLAGRVFGPQDDERASRVAIIDQTLARKYFGRENPLGRRFSIDQTRPEPDIEVIGVVGDSRWVNVRQPTPTIYFPFTTDHLNQMSEKWAQMNFAVRVAGDPAEALRSVRRVVHEIDATLPVAGERTVAEQLGRQFAPERLFAQVSGAFGALAVLLGCVGLFGLVSYTVVSRTTELGVRLALGARPRRILAMILGESMILVAAGVLAGMLAAAVALRLAVNLLYGISPVDPLTYGAVALLLAMVGLLACFVPARRAAKVDPMISLRAE